MLAQRLNMPTPSTSRQDRWSEAYVYLFDLADKNVEEPTERLLDTVLRNHALNWSGFLVRDETSQCGMLWLTSRR